MKTTSDINDVRELIDLHVKENRPFLNLEELYTRIVISLSEGNSHIIYSEDKGVIWGKFGSGMVTGESNFFIGIIFVKKEFRKQGIAREMIEHLREFCKSKNTSSITMAGRNESSKATGKAFGVLAEEHYKIKV